MILDYLYRVSPAALATFAVLATIVFVLSLVCNATAFPETSLLP